MATSLGRSLATRRQLGILCTKAAVPTFLPIHPRVRISFWANIRSSLKSLSGSGGPEEPRLLPTSGFTTIKADQLVEEEELPDYRPDRFYPVRLGEIFQNRYQILAKLGFGSSSTTWLARDLNAHRYAAIKVSYRGRGNIRKLLDAFEVPGPHGKHVTLVFEPAQMSLRDIHPGNMLLGIYNNNLLKSLEEKELTSPVPRKAVSPSRTIYLSRLSLPKEGPMLLSDFGEARIGPGSHGGDIMRLEYRAPETLLYVGWSYPVDIWSVGLTAWDLLEPSGLFTARYEDGELYDAAHLAQLVAALGPPPPVFLAKNPTRRADFWDEQGIVIIHGLPLGKLDKREGNTRSYLANF